MLFTAGVVIGASVAAGQAPWPVIYKDANVSVAFDTASSRRNDDGTFMTRTRWDYTRLHALESRRPYMAMTEVALLRCAPVRIKRLTESFFAANGAVVREGSMPSPQDIRYMTWDRFKPRSEGLKAFTAACASLLRRNRGRG
ncbi:MAG: surface-adhesin E family protein [Gemmatimonadaceae bacterium]